MEPGAFITVRLASRAASPFLSHAGRLPTITQTSTNFTTFLTQMPTYTTFSFSAEVQVILATIPLISLGLVAIGFCAFQLSISRFNWSFLYIFASTGFAFLAGIMQLFNVLMCEFHGMGRMNNALTAAQGVALAVFLSLKFLFLIFRTRTPALHKVPSLASSARRVEVLRTVREEPTSSFEDDRHDTLGRCRLLTAIHSGFDDRLGIIGGLLKTLILVLTLLVGILELIWRIGFLTGASLRYIGVYRTSNALQIILSLVFAGKIVVCATTLELRPRHRNYLAVLPVLIALVLSFVSAVLNLVHGLLAFSDTPLGRFLILVEMFILIMDMVLRDYRRPLRDSSVAFDPNFGVTLATGNKRKGGKNASLPPLPEFIVVRRSSQVPSWLDDRKAADVNRQDSSLGYNTEAFAEDLEAERYENHSGVLDYPTFPTNSTLPSPEHPPQRPTKTAESSYAASVLDVKVVQPLSPILESGSQIILSPEFFAPAVPSYLPPPAPPPLNEVRQKRSAASLKPQSRKASISSFAPSVGAFHDKGLRLSSPFLDLSLNTFDRSQTQYLGSRSPKASSSPPPPPILPLAVEIPPRPKRPNPMPLQRDRLTDTYSIPSEYFTSSQPDPTLDPVARKSEVSDRTGSSNLSLSNFPQPPDEDRSLFRRTVMLEDRARSSTTIQTDGGLEFELVPPRPSFFIDGLTPSSIQTPSFSTLDVTSLIIGAPERAHLHDKLQSVSEGGSSEGAFRSDSPVTSEMGEIRQATIVSRSSRSHSARSARSASTDTVIILARRPTRDSMRWPSRESTSHQNVRVEALGREIPPREGQFISAQEQRVDLPLHLGGLPSNPRLPQPSSFKQSEIVTPRHGDPSRHSPSSSTSPSSSATASPTKHTPSSRYEQPRPAPLASAQSNGHPRAQLVDVGSSMGKPADKLGGKSLSREDTVTRIRDGKAQITMIPEGALENEAVS